MQSLISRIKADSISCGELQYQKELVGENYLLIYHDLRAGEDSHLGLLIMIGCRLLRLDSPSGCHVRLPSRVLIA